MTFSLAQQTLVFLESILLGAISGVIYDICRAIRRTAKLKMLGTIIMDTIFWIIVLIGLFYFAVTDAVSQMRFYVVLGEIGGMLLYFLSFTAFTLPVFCFVIKELLFVICLPIVFIQFIISKAHIVKHFCKHGIEIIKNIKKRLSFFRKSG